VGYKHSDVSDGRTAEDFCTYGVIYSENEDSEFLQNIGRFIPDYTASHHNTALVIAAAYISSNLSQLFIFSQGNNEKFYGGVFEVASITDVNVYEQQGLV
jgi:hypothetical protein